ncbi:lymphotoxin-alpha-like [Notolabrus celidotus]|uniref:lymphotoxin-alpha-like n=1 Tax=Notolabrus celidotus TaxID=1203425 RepID=UPI00148FECA8|nr:lymphotoxin-alpha-like [Notolabrus celidotus]
MDATDGSKLLIRAPQTGDMERQYGQNTWAQLMRQEQRRVHRLSQFMAVVNLILVCAVLALLGVVMLGALGHSPECKPMIKLHSHPRGYMDKQHQLTEVRTPSIMVTAPTGSNSKGGRLVWETNVGRVHSYGGFIYSNGSLVVPRKGLYRVFLQLTFEGMPKRCVPNRELKLVNYVLMYHEKYPKDVTLLTSTDRVNCSPELWSKSLYTSGLFELDAKSRLSVMSSDPDFITKNESEVFFGAELVP